MKKILILGSTGLIGNKIVESLNGKVEVIGASRSHAENPVDISDATSLKALFEKIGKVDAIINTGGATAFAPIAGSDEDWTFSIANKMMGQINTIRFGEQYVNDGGVIILSTGVLAQYPMAGSGMITVVNIAVEGAVKAAAVENERIRINAVSPGWVTETLEAFGMDTAPGMPAAEVAMHYVDLIDNSSSGDIVVAAKG